MIAPFSRLSRVLMKRSIASAASREVNSGPAPGGGKQAALTMGPARTDAIANAPKVPYIPKIRSQRSHGLVPLLLHQFHTPKPRSGLRVAMAAWASSRDRRHPRELRLSP